MTLETFTLRKSEVNVCLAFAKVHSFCRVMASDTVDEQTRFSFLLSRNVLSYRREKQHHTDFKCLFSLTGTKLQNWCVYLSVEAYEWASEWASEWRNAAELLLTPQRRITKHQIFESCKRKKKKKTRVNFRLWKRLLAGRLNAAGWLSVSITQRSTSFKQTQRQCRCQVHSECFSYSGSD